MFYRTSSNYGGEFWVITYFCDICDIVTKKDVFIGIHPGIKALIVRLKLPELFIPDQSYNLCEG